MVLALLGCRLSSLLPGGDEEVATLPTATPQPTDTPEPTQPPEPSDVAVPGDQAEAERKREEQMASLEEHVAYLDGKLTSLLQAVEDDQDWTAWSSAWNEDLEEQKEAFRQQFGANISAYTGHCQLAFFHVAEAYADTFIVWQRYDGYISGQRDGTELEQTTDDLRALLEEAQAEIAACRES